MRQRAGQVVHHHGDLSGHQVGHGWCRALVRNMDQVGAGALAEQLAGQVDRLAGARRRKGVLARLRPGQRNEFGDGAGRHAGIDHQHIGHRHHQGDRRKVLGAVRQLPVQAVVDGIGPDIAHHQGVAVSGRLPERLRADDAASAGAVFHHHRLAEQLAHALADQARGDIGRATRGRRHDQPDRLVGICRRRCAGGRHEGRTKRQPQSIESLLHRRLLLRPRHACAMWSWARRRVTISRPSGRSEFTFRERRLLPDGSRAYGVARYRRVIVPVVKKPGCASTLQRLSTPVSGTNSAVSAAQWPYGKLKPALETADIRLEPADSEDELPIAGEPGEVPP
ncbi:hypothetical protein CBM2633_B90007 [Cupriavidus taiwanensis]|nr:hypothetical protein CBM2633_B90007 [Cupriavidus taiwanensis]